MRDPCVCIVSDTTDSLAIETAKALVATGISVVAIEPSGLAECRVAVTNEFFYLNEHLVGGILFRTSPDSAFSAGFVPEDRAFSDSEARAIWLAALNLPSVLSINRYDAVSWFEGLCWSLWRRRLVESRVEVADFTFGGSGNGWWYPYYSVAPQKEPDSLTCRLLGGAIARPTLYRATLMVCNDLIPKSLDASLLKASRVLREYGISLAEIVTDSKNEIILVNTRPNILNPEWLQSAAGLISTAYENHFISREH